MALKWGDRVEETTATTGTGALTLAGAVTGRQAFSAVLSTADTCYGFIENQDVPSEWEVCLLTMQSNGTLTRSGVITSSNSGSLVSFSAGTKRVALDVVSTVVASLVGMSYVSLSTDSILSNERVLTAGTGITITDGGAGSTVTITSTGASGFTQGSIPFADSGGTLTQHNAVLYWYDAAAADSTHSNLYLGCNDSTKGTSALAGCLYVQTTDAFRAGIVIQNGFNPQSFPPLVIQDFDGTQLFSVSGAGTMTSTGAGTFNLSSTNTTAQQTAFTLGRLVTSGTPAANMGLVSRVVMSSSTLTSRTASDQLTYWVSATDATRKAGWKQRVYDTAARVAIETQASGSAAMLGFYGVTPVVKPGPYSVTNSSPLRSYNATSGSLAQLLQVVAALIADLQALGLVG